MSDRYRNSEPSTSELRHDWLTDRWVIIAPQRNERPDDFTAACLPQSADDLSQVNCPFCGGHEAETPPPLALYSADGIANESAHWLVRVVPNKFPAVNGVQTLKFATLASVEGVKTVEGVQSIEESAAPHHHHSSDAGEGRSDPGARPVIDLFQARHVSGAHEVFIESPQHLCSLTQLDRPTTTMIFRAYRDRVLHWSRCTDIEYAVIFKNVGLDAGASLVHTHSQLIATNILPPDVRRAIERMEVYEKSEQACLFCRMLADELEENVRIVAQTTDYVAFCPFASRLPSLVTVVPRDHRGGFETTSDDSIERLAWLVHRLVRSIELCYPHAAYNYVLHTAPRGHCHSRAFHWRLEIFPRLTRVAGFEWGSDCFINPLPPEIAAHRLREQLASE